MIKYTKMQKKYIDSVDGKAHIPAVEIIGLMEKTIEALIELNASNRTNKQPPGWIAVVLGAARDKGIL